VDSQANSTLIGQVFSHLSVHVRYIQVNALFHFLFGQPPHLGLLPGLAPHFYFLWCGVKYMAHAHSLLRWQLFACKTQHAFVLAQGHTANSATSIFGSSQFAFGSMVYISTSVHIKRIAVENSTTFGSSYAPGPLSGKETLQFPLTGVNSLSCSKRVDHQVLLAVDTNTSLVPFSAVVPQ